VRDLRTVELTAPVGKRFQYSNYIFNVLGLIVQTVSGQSYEDYVQQHIFVPLEMSHSYTSAEQAREHDRAMGHRYWFGWPFAYEMPYNRAQLPSGFINASAQDMTHYLIAQLDGGRYKDAQVLSSRGIAEIFSRAPDNRSGQLELRGQFQDNLLLVRRDYRELDTVIGVPLSLYGFYLVRVGLRTMHGVSPCPYWRRLLGKGEGRSIVNLQSGGARRWKAVVRPPIRIVLATLLVGGVVAGVQVAVKLLRGVLSLGGAVPVVYYVAYLIVSVLVAYFVYRAYARLVEKRAVSELSRTGASRELGVGALLGLGLIALRLGCCGYSASTAWWAQMPLRWWCSSRWPTMEPGPLWRRFCCGG
jgi:hypothetical protein